MKEKDEKVSRRLFLALGSTAAASPFFLSGNSTYASGLTSIPLSNNLMFIQDPATTIAVIKGGLDVAIKLKELFGKKSGGANAKLLANIQKQNAQIIKMLGEVLVILGNLGVTIRAGVRDELLNDIKVTLKVAFERFYDTWEVELNNPDDARIRDRATEQYKTFYNTIADLGRKIATTESYGYAHFHTVGHAMLVEMWISQRLGEARDFRQQAARSYAKYFETVLNPTEAGSVAGQLIAAQEQVARMDKILVDADKTLEGYPADTVAKRKVVGQKGLTTYYADIVRYLAGDREKGYSYRDVRIKEWSEREPSSRHFISTQDAIKLRTDPTIANNTVPGRVNYLNSVRTVYLAAKSEADALEKSKDTANIYLDAAREIISNP
jgi:hypothetical protein